MTANPETLEKIVNTIRSEVPKYLSPEFVVHDVTAENRPGPDDEEYVHIRVILEYDHPKLDTQVLMQVPHRHRRPLRTTYRSSITRTPPTPTSAI